MQELINIFQYEEDLKRFNHDWEELRIFTRQEGINGIDHLIGSDMATPNIPENLVKSVHLLGSFGRTRTWNDPHSIPPDCDPFEVSYYYGVATPQGLLETFQTNIERSASFIVPVCSRA